MLDHTTLTTELGEEDGRWRGAEGLADQSLGFGGVKEEKGRRGGVWGREMQKRRWEGN